MSRYLSTALLLLLLLPLSVSAQRRGFFSDMTAERKVLAQYDADSNGVLNASERQAALAGLQAQGGGRSRWMFGGSRQVAVTPGPRLSPAEVPPVAPMVPLFDGRTLRTIFLTFEDADWLKELIAFNNTDIELLANATVDGQSYPDVGVHTRGASSFMMVPEGQKLSLNVSFDFLRKGQALLGSKSLNLLNAHGDPSLVRAALYLRIAREYLPAPQANFVRVVINGESWGAFTNQEQVGKEFVEAHFGAKGGTRWKVTGSPDGQGGIEYLGDDPKPYRDIYDIKSKDLPEAWAALAHFAKVLNQTPPAQLEKALEPLLDVDEALRFLALDVALVNTDGFWTRASDYYLYLDTTGKFHFIPWDTNESMPEGGEGRGPGGPPPMGAPPMGGPPPGGMGGGRGGRGGFGFMMEGTPTLDPLVNIADTTKALRARLLAVPALRARYLGYVREIATHWLDWKTLGPIAEEYHNLIAPVARTDTRKLDSTAEFDAGLEALRGFADQRRAFLLGWKEPR